MKQKFSTHWLSSKQPRKQRKYRLNAPLHLKHKFLNAHLSKELRNKYGKRSFPIRKGDEVLVMRGSFAKKKGKILEVNLKKSKVTIEGINRRKSDGTKVNVYLNASNLQIQSLNLEDRKRIKALNRGKVEKFKEENKTEEKNVSKES
ncbi:MAG: 50S ribosomal protein L24 [Nanoarchaeota archaeon]|nr:50S ribosomal protein L24 [Nanoarchaeota archaeon]